MPRCRPRSARKPTVPAAVAATSSTSQADTDALENVIELVRKHKPADATQAEADDFGSGGAENSRNGSSCAATTTAPRSSAIALSSSANPSWPSQTFLRRRLEAALWDDRRDDATVWSWFENESPISAKGRFALAKRTDRARRPRQCGAPGARRLAQRCDVRGHRNHGAGSVRRVAHARRSQGADGPLLYGTEQEAAAMRAAKRLGSRLCRAGEGAHRGHEEGIQSQGVARSGAARTARRRRLSLRQDPVASPRGEIRRGRATDAERAEGPGPPATISTNGGSSGGCWRARCSTSASTAPPI